MEESAEAAKAPEQYNRKLINLLGGIALTLAVLMILLDGLLAAQLDVSIIGVVACVISFGLLFGLFRLVNKIVRRQAPEQEDQPFASVPTGKQPYVKVKEE